MREVIMSLKVMVATQPATPVLWQVLATVCRLSAAESGAWWRALQRSTWSEVTAWRRTLHAADALIRHPDTAEAWVHAHATPGDLLRMLDLLYGERLLPLRMRNTLVEKVLRMTTKAGSWK
jgi:hypothetical protein